MHCWGGADRTGTVAFILEGLCGVSEADLAIDYELTSFTMFGLRTRVNRGTANYADVIARIKSYPGATLQEKFEAYAKGTLGLADADFDDEAGTLAVRDSKFGASRLIPVADDVADRIAGYMGSRDGSLRARNLPQMIVSTGGKPLTGDSAEGMFAEVRWSLLDRGQSFAGRKPRLHDLRHAFSVAAILRWHAEGEDVNSMMPYLSAYLGHRKLSDTYWHLTGVPELMAVAADSFRAMGLGGDGL